MRNIFAMWLSLIFLMVPNIGWSGSLDAPAGPTSATSAMYTLEDLYNRLYDGTAGIKRSGPFAEPSSGPTTVTGHTLDEIMAMAPAIDGSAALSGNVANGKKFWGLATGGWGLVTGTAIISTGDAAAADVLTGKTFSNASAAGVSGAMANNGNGRTITPTTSPQPIAAGYWSTVNTVAGDANLLPVNIKSGVSIFGVTGTAPIPTGDAAAADVLTGKTFSNASSTGLTGTMANNGAVNITPGTVAQTIAAGYHNGSGIAMGDSNLVSGKIQAGVTIFGVTGTSPIPTGDAAAADVLTGKTFSNASAAWVSGTRPPAPVPRTGQTSTAPLNSPPTGSDGALQKGVTWPTTRFTDNNNGTVTDNLTGLIWLKNANCTDTVGGINKNVTDIEGKLSWLSALTWCNNLAATSCGLTDGSTAGQWRLPNRFELESLLDLSKDRPPLPAEHPFNNVKSDYYWSSTSEVLIATSYAWYVSMASGLVRSAVKTDTNYVWPVRAGQ